MTGTVVLNIVYDRFVDGLIGKDEKVASPKFITKLAKIRAKNPYYLGPHIPT